MLCTIYHENSFCGNVSENISLQFTISIVAVGFVGKITAMSEKSLRELLWNKKEICDFFLLFEFLRVFLYIFILVSNQFNLVNRLKFVGWVCIALETMKSRVTVAINEIRRDYVIQPEGGSNCCSTLHIYPRGFYL